MSIRNRAVSSWHFDEIAEGRPEKKIKEEPTLFISYPLVNKQFAIRNGHRNSGFSHS